MRSGEAAQQPCPPSLLDVDRVAEKAAAAELVDGRRPEQLLCQAHGGRCLSGLRAMAADAGHLRAAERVAERVPNGPDESTKGGHELD